MKFTVKTTMRQSAARLGELSNILSQPNTILETPLALLHTQAGHVPHITHEVLKLVTKQPQILQIPVVSMQNYEDAIQLYEGRLSTFIGSKNSLSYVTLHDPSESMKQGHHSKGKVPVFTKRGKVLYDTEKYMNMVEKFQPDMYVLLSDSDTNIASLNKRITKAVENTVTFSEECLERHKKSDSLKDSFVIAPIAGGYCLKSREKCIEHQLKNDEYIQGYLIDGLHNNGPEVELLSYSDVKPVVESVIKKLPSEKLKVVQGCWNPLNILKLVSEGVDLFDTSYCRTLTERSAALIFAITAQEETEGYEINLRQNQFAEDFKPLLLNCTCAACKGYSRAYIHHLLTVQELLGSVLIMIHNVHHMLRFFEEIRGRIRTNNLKELEESIARQFEAMSCKRQDYGLEEVVGSDRLRARVLGDDF